MERIPPSKPRPSRVETKMHCVKLLGQRRMARDFDRQVAAFQIRVAVLNGFTTRGNPRLKDHGIGLSGDSGSPAVSRFVQQGPLGAVSVEHLVGIACVFGGSDDLAVLVKCLIRN